MFASLHKSYFYLCRAAIELNNLMRHQSILSCYTQEKDKLYIHIPLKEFPHFHLIVNTNPQEHSIQIKNEHYKANKNVFEFFKSSLPQKIRSVTFALGERIIRLELEQGSIYILFRGSKSNCLYISRQGDFESFKKHSRQQELDAKTEIAKGIFIDDIYSLQSVIDNLNDEQIRKLPFIAKEIFLALDGKIGLLHELIKKVIEEIFTQKIAVGVNPNNGLTFFSPLSFLQEGDEAEIELFDSYFEALDYLFRIKRESNRETTLKSEIEKFLEKELGKLSNKLNCLKSRIENGSKEIQFKKYGDLLLANINKLKKGISSIQITDWSTGEAVRINLDEKASPQQNIDKYYDKARSEKIESAKSKELFDETEIKYRKLLEIKLQLSDELSLEELSKIKKQLKIVNQYTTLKGQTERIPYRHFIIADKYHFYIGKDSKNNDQLTTKFAKQNDYWFHARSVAGSHGVLRVENTKEPIPKRILEKASSITAFYSKAKTSKLASVTYTLKKYVVKNQRHEPGQVLVLKENVLLVKPEIPNDCVLKED